MLTTVQAQTMEYARGQITVAVMMASLVSYFCCEIQGSGNELFELLFF